MSLPLVSRSLLYYWRTNLAVVAGVATAVAVLSGALLVGESVRASLRELALERLGPTEQIVSGPDFFREQLARELNACPLIALQGMLRDPESGRQASRVEIYGIDARFAIFTGWRIQTPSGRQALLTPALARELGPGGSLLLTVESPSEIPLESLHGRKDRVGRTLRLNVAGVFEREFSIHARQGSVRAVYVPLQLLQQELERPRQINTVLAAGIPALELELQRHFRLEDLGIRLRALEPSRVISLEKRSALLDEELARAGQSAARRLGFEAAPVFTYLANTIRAGGREVPYSLVSAMDLGALGATEAAANAILLNEWAARDLEAKPGDAVTLEFYVWKDDGRLETESASFQFAGAVPIAGIAAGRDLAPEYPGISGAESLDNWDPPFPMDLGRVRPADEDYWDRYRTTPKAFLPLARGQQLWRSRFGSLTSLRVAAPEGRTLEETSSAFEGELRSSLDLARRGLALRPARAQALEAAQGATDFGRYFAYFSFFLVVSALLLAWLFFKLGVEQRLREIGVLLAIGIPRRKVGDLFLREGLALAVAGGLAGAAGAVAYAWLILLGLRTVWVDAVGTRLIELHVSGGTLAAGAQAGVAVALAAIIWTLRGLRGRTTRELLAGALPPAPPSRPLATWQAVLALASLITAGLLIAGAATGRVLEVPAFFTAGTLLLIGALLFQKLWLARNRAGPLRSIAALGFRNASARPGRSALCIALIASAAYILVAVEAFRRPPGPAGLDEFPLMAESLLPIVHNPNLDSGREALNLSRVPLEGVRFVPFRLRPGDDASCLNLYQPREPRVLGAPESFLLSHPWLLLRQPLPDGAIPALADANSLQYALHLKVGDSVEIGGRKLRIVAALEDSIFQSELIVSEPGFLRAFPEQEGFRFFLIQAKPEISGPLEEALADYGFDVTPTAERLAGFHRVENTYISTFQALGALGLLLGTVGLAAVLLRNALERRRELALLEAVGFRGRSLKWMVLVENGLLLVLGLLTGVFSALLAVAPALGARASRPGVGLALMLAAVLAAGLAASLIAARAALRGRLLEALRAE